MTTPRNMTPGKKKPKATLNLITEHNIMMANKGDWKAQNNLIKDFQTLLYSLAEKRSSDRHDINEYIEAGKTGLMTAVKKYDPSIGVDKFELFALAYIEKAMNRKHSGRGFLSRLFGK